MPLLDILAEFFQQAESRAVVTPDTINNLAFIESWGEQLVVVRLLW